MEIKFSGIYEKQEYIKGVRRAVRPGTWGNLFRYVYLFGFAILLIVIFVIEISGDGLQTSEISRFFRYAVVVLGFIGVAVYNLIRTRRMAIRLWQFSTLRGITTGSVSSEGISFYSQLQPWGQFMQKDVSEDMIVLMTDGRKIAILPRHFFQSESDWERVRQLVERKVIEPK